MEIARSSPRSVTIFAIAVILLLLIAPRSAPAFGFHTHIGHGSHHHSYYGYYGSHYGGHSYHYGGYYPGYNYAYSPYYASPFYYGGYRPNYYAHRAPYAVTIRPQHRDYGEFNGRGLIDQSHPKTAARSDAYPSASQRSDSGPSSSSRPNSAEPTPYPELPTMNTADNNPATSGWALLADQPSAALATFAVEATNNPTQGLPKAGYAVAQALLNNDTRAIWAMRRALAFEAHALHYAPLDANLEKRIDELIVGYRHRLDQGSGRPGDDQVMIASLAYMQHDYEIALPAATAAIDIGDRQPTTRALLELIKQELAD